MLKGMNMSEVFQSLIKFKNLVSILSLVFLLQSCFLEDTPRKKRRFSGPSNENDTVPVTKVDPNPFKNERIELRFMVDPASGAYQSKLTIPRNYNDILYISGLNLSVLASEQIYARFKFGKDYKTIDIPVTVTTAPGITPNTKVQVLALNLVNSPFLDVPLNYQLFDHNQYDYTDAAEEYSQDNRDTLLFCRGLNIDDDHTSNKETCAAADDKCLYTYAEIADRSWKRVGAGLIHDILYPQVALSQNYYFEDDVKDYLNKCLDDSSRQNYPYDSDVNEISYGMDPVKFGSGFLQPKYAFEGPYMAINEQDWQVSEDAIFGEWGIFEKRLEAGSNDPNLGYYSRLFPIFTKRQVQADVEHRSLASTDRTAATDLLSQTKSYASPQESDWMHGCNQRISSLNSSTGEDISSCNVTASIELFFYDVETQKEVIVLGPDSENGDKNGTISTKLQLVKPSNLSGNGGVLHESFNTCTENNECGSGECCFNGRCWSEDLVSQCSDTGQGTGYQDVGTSCNSDFKCASLCCRRIPGSSNDIYEGTCEEHDNTDDDAEDIFNYLNNVSGTSFDNNCNKEEEESCIISSFCKPAKVVKKVVINCEDNPGAYDHDNDNDTPPQQVNCGIKYFEVPFAHGDCVEGKCRPPQDFPDPVPGNQYDWVAPDCVNLTEEPEDEWVEIDPPNGEIVPQCGS